MTTDELAVLFMNERPGMLEHAYRHMGGRLDHDQLDFIYVSLWPQMATNIHTIRKPEHYIWISYRHALISFTRSREGKTWMSSISLTNTLEPIDTRERDAYNAECQAALVEASLKAMPPALVQVGWYTYAQDHSMREAAAYFKISRRRTAKLLQDFRDAFKPIYNQLSKHGILVDLPEPTW